MPELPEVETVVRNLRGDNPYKTGIAERKPATILGRDILGAEVYWARTIAAPETGFAARISGQRIEGAGRRAKYIVIQLTRDVLVVHLRMTGDLFLRAVGEPVEKHDRVVLHLSEGQDLVFNDPRKFGRVWLVEGTGGLFAKLGPEPLGDTFTAEWFYAALQKRRRQIKPLLLDQGFLAGVGNIYADESLHLSKIHPLRIADSLSMAEAALLRENIRNVLEQGIEHNGASIDWAYRGGEFQNHFRVYGRGGEACSTCGEPIEKIVVGQRGTHFCPGCQRLDET